MCMNAFRMAKLAFGVRFAAADGVIESAHHYFMYLRACCILVATNMR
jgi:hypothetical protein